MSGFRTILVGADFSALSRAAFRQAHSLASDRGARLVVLHVVEPTHPSRQPIVPDEPPVACRVEQAYLREHVPTVPEEFPRTSEFEARLRRHYEARGPALVEYRLGYGHAEEEILHAAAEIGADLIALGAYGRGGLGGLFMGSTAEAVIRRARCPVLALRLPDGGDILGDLQQAEVVLHPTDFSARSAAALDLAASISRDRGARLVILHVDSDDSPPSGPAEGPPCRRLCLEELDEVRGRLAHGGHEALIGVELRRGDPAWEILDAADELEADLIVMGTHGRSGLGRMLLGSVAETVLQAANCPVLVVKARRLGALTAGPSVESHLAEVGTHPPAVRTPNSPTP
jgi:nucleotide-binding universal stress UspA family protein